MEAQKPIIVKKQVNKIIKKRPTSVMEIVKTDGTEAGASAEIKTLRKARVSYFEILDPDKNTKTCYKKFLSGSNYSIKTVKIE
jgi:hypothetical protein